MKAPVFVCYLNENPQDREIVEIKVDDGVEAGEHLFYLVNGVERRDFFLHPGEATVSDLEAGLAELGSNRPRIEPIENSDLCRVMFT